MRNVTTDDEDIFDENGILIDGKTRTVPMFMMDSIQREIASDQRARAAFKETKEMTKADPRDEAFAAQSRYLADAWKTPQAKSPPKIIPTGYVESAKRAEPLPFDWAKAPAMRTTAPSPASNRPSGASRTSDVRDRAYAEQGQRIRDAWKHPRAA